MKEQKVISKAKQVLITNKGNTSTYYKELKKTLQEYSELKNKDKTTINLYLEHITNLCDLIDENKNVNTTLGIVIIAIVAMLIITITLTIKYYEIKYDIKDDVIKINNNASLVVEYENLDTYKLNYSDNYENTEPIKIKIKGVSKDNIKRKMHYDIYIRPLSKEIPKDKINYLIGKDNGIKNLNNVTINDESILIYSGMIECGRKKELNLYMWLNDYNYVNNVFYYEIYVDGYEE